MLECVIGLDCWHLNARYTQVEALLLESLIEISTDLNAMATALNDQGRV